MIPPNDVPVKYIGIPTYNTLVPFVVGIVNQLPLALVLVILTDVVPALVTVYGPPDVVKPPILASTLNCILA